MNNYRKIAFFACLIALIGGCAGSKAHHRYTCNNGSSFEVAITQKGEKAVLRLHNEKFVLHHVPSGKGAKYRSGSIIYWAQGDEAIVSIDGAIAYRGRTNVN